MPRRDRTSSLPFPHLGPTGAALPISSGSARLTRETDGSVLLEVNGVPSSHLHPDPEHLVFEYMRWMLLAIDQHRGGVEGPAQIAHLGGGGCSLPRAVAARRPSWRQVVVEIDDLLAEQVRTWFDLPRAPQLRLRVGDARDALESWREDRFDVVVRDVFSGSTTPARLVETAAVQEVRRVLRPGGLYLANCAAPPGTTDLADEIATLAEHFRHVGAIAEPAHLTGKRRGNCVLLASAQPLPEGLDRALRSNAVSVRLTPAAHVRALARAGKVLGTPSPTPPGPSASPSPPPA